MKRLDGPPRPRPPAGGRSWSRLLRLATPPRRGGCAIAWRRAAFPRPCSTIGRLSPAMAETLRTSPAVDLIPARLAHFYSMVPVSVADGVLALGLTTSDTPALVPAVEELTGLRVEPLICPPSLVTDVLSRF